MREAGAEASQAGAGTAGRGPSGNGAASLLGDASLAAEKVGSGARVEIFVGDSIRLSVPLGEPEVIAAVVHRLRTPELASRTAERSAVATTAGAFRRIQVVSGR